MQNCTFKTIGSKSEGLYKEKGSKFIAFAFPITSESDVKKIVAEVTHEHHSARHHCWAYRLGADGSSFRLNDDGEPSNSAGKPILGQIDAYSLTNILIVVVRYFGGTLLGVGGLIQAYKDSAKDALEHALIIEKEVEVLYVITFPYELSNVVMSVIKQIQGTIQQQTLENQCEIVCAIPKSQEVYFKKYFELQPKIHLENKYE